MNRYILFLELTHASINRTAIMGCKNSKIPKPKLSGDDSKSPFPYIRGSKDARVRSQQVSLPQSFKSSSSTY